MNRSPKNWLLTPNSFSFRLAMAITATMILVSVSLALFEVQQERDFFTERTLLLESERAQLIAQTFERDIEEVQRDIRTLSGATAVDAMVTFASELPGNEDLFRSPDFLTCGSQLGKIFEAFLGSHTELRQIRLIGLADNGQELVRVDRVDGRIIVVSPADLQQKADRDYFQASLSLKPGETFVSDITLNQEHGKLDFPYWPTVRVTTPVYRADGTMFGILVMNVNAAPILDAFVRGLSKGNAGFVLNANSDFLVHPDPEKAFGFDKGTPYRWSDEFPDFDIPPDGVSKMDATFTHSGRKVSSPFSFVAVNKVVLDPQTPEKFVTLVVGIKKNMLGALVDPRLGVALGGTLVAAFLLSVGLISYMRRTLRPLEDLTLAARQMQAGHFSFRLPRTNVPELAPLVDAMNGMRQELHVREKSPVMMVTLDSEGHILTVNDECLRKLGRTELEVIGKTIGSFSTPDGVREAETRWRPLLRRSGHLKGISFPLVTKEGRIVNTVLSANAIRNDSGAVTRSLVVMIDVSEQKLAEEQLRQAQKMESIGNLTGGIAHDFNNLLAVILGNLQLLQRSVSEDAKLGKLADNAVEATLRGAQLTKQLLAFARRQTLTPQVLQANELIENMQTMLSRTIGATIEIKTDLDPDLPTIEVDPVQLESAILNLTINARDAMPDGGSLTIDTSLVRVSTRDARLVDDLEPGDYCCLSVSDTGSGMSREVLSQIFEPFFTTKGVGKGTGLGLSMIYGFVQQSGGTIRAYSEEGRGTRIAIYIPAVDGPATAQTAKATGPELPRGTETILLVEDDPKVRDIASILMEDLGYSVVTAEDGPAALECIDRGPDIDLVLSDMVMPGGLSGQALADRLRERYPTLPIILSSGFPRDGFGAGQTYPFLQKPYTQQALAVAIRKVLQRFG